MVTSPRSTQLGRGGESAAEAMLGQLNAELAGSDGGCYAQVSLGIGCPQGRHILGLRPSEGHQVYILISALSTRKVSLCQGSICARPPRHTLVIFGGSPGGLVRKEVINQEAGARPGA